MEEKARIYEDLKSGMYLAAGSEEEEDEDDIGPSRPPGDQQGHLARLRRKEREGLVDFDRKWADEERARGKEESYSDSDDDNASIISYEDELGRTHHGTRKEAAQVAGLEQQDDPQRWKPARPENLIYGSTIQAEAFNPSGHVAEQMSHLASRRDRSPTPPDPIHYDPESEVRSRGTGFYAFSRDEETRRKEMEELLNVRDETLRERDSHQARKAERERSKDERRKKIEALRVRRRADKFLAGLSDLGVGPV